MKWIKQNWFKIVLLAPILVGGFSIFYYFVILLPGLKLNEINIGKMESYRTECRKEIEDDFKFFDKMSPELAMIGLRNRKYVDEAGNFIKMDILVKRCMDSKVLIYK